MSNKIKTHSLYHDDFKKARDTSERINKSVHVSQAPLTSSIKMFPSEKHGLWENSLISERGREREMKKVGNKDEQESINAGIMIVGC